MIEKEKDIKEKVIKHALILGFVNYSPASIYALGIPDRIFHYKGKTFYIEFKSSNVEKLTKAQTIYRNMLQRVGIDVYVINSSKQGIELLERLK